jgi:hypothetical protein
MYLVSSIGQLFDGKRLKKLHCTGFIFGQAGDGSLDFVSCWGVVELQHFIDENGLVFYPLRRFVHSTRPGSTLNSEFHEVPSAFYKIPSFSFYRLDYGRERHHWYDFA